MIEKSFIVKTARNNAKVIFEKSIDDLIKKYDLTSTFFIVDSYFLSLIPKNLGKKYNIFQILLYTQSGALESIWTLQSSNFLH